MMPMVFWASLPPWPRLKAAAESSWRRRNSPSTRLGLERRKIHMLASISRNPRVMPSSGDSGIQRMVFSRLPASRTPKPALATPAPAKPPIRACDDEVGRPSHQVMKFQAMAPTSPAKMTASLTTSASTILPTVLATWVWKTRKAMKLNRAAQMTAIRGVRTLVDTTVAIELAASWKPLVKSNTSASRTMAMTERRARSGMLDDDGLHRVGDVLEAVERLLELLDDVLPDEHVAGRVLGVEVVEVGPGSAVEPVALVLGLDQPLGLHLRVDEVLDHVQQLPGGVGEVGRDLVEQVEVRLLAGKDPQSHVSSRRRGKH